MTTAANPTATVLSPDCGKTEARRVSSIDAMRGLVMFTMIFVNDLAGGGEIVPNWMVHFSERHHGGSGMTFVDLVFPSFLFIVGMSIPFALGGRIERGEPMGKTLWHIATRTAALLSIGILTVNGDSGGGGLWEFKMFASSILAFCAIAPRRTAAESARFWRAFNLCLRVIGLAGMVYCAFTFHGKKGQHIITLSPFHIRTSWYGILGLIGWSYMVAAIVFLFFRVNRTALLGSVAVLFCFYPATQTGEFEHFGIAQHVVSFDDTIGSHAAIAVAGILLAAMLVDPMMSDWRTKAKFTWLYIGGFASAALLLNGLYGISKNDATPSWCLWSCAIAAALWLGLYYVCDIASIQWISRPLMAAGQNVLLAYLLSDLLPNPLALFGGDSLAWVICRSLLWALLLLRLTVALNRIGFRLKI